MWWHTRRNQISSFGETDESISIGGGPSVQSTTGSRGVRISGSNAGYTMFRGSVKGTGYPLHSPVSLSLPLRASPCAITFQLESVTNISHVQRKRIGFWRVHNLVNSDCQLCRVSLSRHLPVVFSWNLRMSIFRQYVEKIDVTSKSGKNNGCLTWRHIHIYDNISL